MTTSIIISRESTMTAEGKHVNGCSKPVFCMTTGKVWPSVADAAKEIGVAPCYLSHVMLNKKPYKGNMYRHMSESESCIPAMLARIQALSEVEAKAKAYDEAMEKLEKQRKAEEKKQAQIDKLHEKKQRLEEQLARVNEELATLEGKGDVA